MSNTPARKLSLFIPLIAGLALTFGLVLSLDPGAARAAPASEVCFVDADGDNTTDYMSSDGFAVQDAVNNAMAGDELHLAGWCDSVFATAGLTQTVYISKSLTIIGGYDNTNWAAGPDPDNFPTTLVAWDNGRVLVIQGAVDVSLENLVIMRGFAPVDVLNGPRENGGGIWSSATLTLTNVTLQENFAENDGGGLHNEGGLVTILSSTIMSNTADSIGGGLHNAAGTILIANSTFQGNGSLDAGMTSDGGGITNDEGYLDVQNSFFHHNIGDEGGAIDNSDGTVVVSGTTFLSNTATSYGGGIFSDGVSAITVTNSTFQENWADYGGAIETTTSGNVMFVIEGSDFLSNTAATDGGAIWYDRFDVYTISDSVFQFNTARDGGAISGRAALTLSDSVVSDNSATRDGGGIYAEGDMVLDKVTLTGNTAASEGGGIVWEDGIYTVTNSTFSGNHADYGGAIGYSTNGGQIFISDTDFIGNIADTTGGALYTDVSSLTITGSNFESNMAGEEGGAIYNYADLVIQATVFFSNTAVDNGGALYNRDGMALVEDTEFSGNSATKGGALMVDDHATVVNSTISGNAAEDGGGIYTTALLTLTHVTISDNNAAAGGGINVSSLSSVNISSSIIANSTGGDCANAGAFTDAGYNLVEDGSCITAGTSLSGDPMLGPLADNGGDTQTHALLTGSPAIDHVPPGSCAVVVDQRGVARPFGDGCDIGAYEFDTYTIFLPVILNEPTSAEAGTGNTSLEALSGLALAGLLIGLVFQERDFPKSA